MEEKKEDKQWMCVSGLGGAARVAMLQSVRTGVQSWTSFSKYGTNNIPQEMTEE